MQNLNIAVNDSVRPDFDVGRMSNCGLEYMGLKHLPLGDVDKIGKLYLTC